MDSAVFLLPGVQENPMHVHGNQMNFNTINPYSAAAEKAMAAQRAANVRKKLVKCAADPESDATTEETLMISSWMNQSQGAKR